MADFTLEIYDKMDQLKGEPGLHIVHSLPYVLRKKAARDNSVLYFDPMNPLVDLDDVSSQYVGIDYWFSTTMIMPIADFDGDKYGTLNKSSSWDISGGSFQTVSATTEGISTNALLQSDTTETEWYATARRTFQTLTGFVLLLYLYEPSFQQEVRVYFGRRYYLSIKRSGCILYRKSQSVDASESYSGTFEEVASGNLPDDAYNRWLWLDFHCFDHQTIFVRELRGSRFICTYRETDLWEEQVTLPNNRTSTVKSPWLSYHPRVWASGGAAMFALGRWKNQNAEARYLSEVIDTNRITASTGTVKIDWDVEDSWSSYIDRVEILNEGAGLWDSPLISVTEPQSIDSYALPTRFRYRVLFVSTDELYSPALRRVRIRFIPDDTSQTVSTTTIRAADIQAVDGTFSEDGRRKATITIYNNRDANGTTYDSILFGKSNRPCVLKVDGSAVITGYVTNPRYTDELKETIVVTVEDKAKQLEHMLLKHSIALGNMSYVEALRTLFGMCGWVEGTDYSISSDVLNRGDMMPYDLDGDEPAYVVRAGQKVSEVLRHFESELTFDRFEVDSSGVLHVREDWINVAGDPTTNAPVSSRVFYMKTSDAEAVGEGDWVIIGRVEYYTDERGFANQVTVAGLDRYKMEVITSSIVDTRSIDDPTVNNYVGEPRLLVIINPDLRSQRDVDLVAHRAICKVRRLIKTARLTSRWDQNLNVRDTVTILYPTGSVNAPNTVWGSQSTLWRVKSIQFQYGQRDERLDWPTATYVLERVEELHSI